MTPRPLVEEWLALLALQRVEHRRIARRTDLLALGVHIVGLTMLWMLFQFPAGLSLLLALGSLGALLAPQFVASWRTRQLAVQSGMLAPLLLVYAVILIRLWLKYGLGWQLPIYVPGESLDLFAALLTTENILLAAVAYVVLIQLAQSSGERWTRRAGYLLVLLTFGWASWEYIGHRAAGVRRAINTHTRKWR